MTKVRAEILEVISEILEDNSVDVGILCLDFFDTLDEKDFSLLSDKQFLENLINFLESK